jgi:hypothetical protein
VLQDTPGQQNTALAFQAFQADIRPQPHHLPLIAAAGVGLPEPNHVTELELHDHKNASKLKTESRLNKGK